MKLSQIDGKWYFEKENAVPVKKLIQEVLNKDVDPKIYVLAEGEDKDTFTAMSYKGDELDGLFSLRFIELPEPETVPIIVFFNIFDPDLAEKLRRFFKIHFPVSKVLTTKAEEITPEIIQSIVSMFEK